LKDRIDTYINQSYYSQSLKGKRTFPQQEIDTFDDLQLFARMLSGKQAAGNIQAVVNSIKNRRENLIVLI